MIKIVAIDMDGTLLNNAGKITPATTAAIHKYQAQGGIVVINTGRAFPMAARIVEAADISCNYICLNGAGVFTSDGTCIQYDGIAYEDIKLLREIEKKYDLFVDYLTSEGAKTSSTQAFTEKHYIYQALEMAKEQGVQITPADALNRFHSILSYIQYEQDVEALMTRNAVFYKLAMVALNAETLTEVKSLLKNMPQFEVSSSFKTNIEITSSRVDKGRTLIEFARSLGIPPEEVMVIGDSENDIPMLNKPFGKTVAMGNADDKIKALCTHVTLTNEEDGVAWAIEKWAMPKIML